MIHIRLHQVAEEASARYASLMQGWRGAFYDVAMSANPFTAKSLTRLKQDAYSIGRNYLVAEADRIEAVTSEFAWEGLHGTLRAYSVATPAELPPLVSEHLAAIQRHLLAEITVQIERDVAHVVHALSSMALEVSLTARSQGVTEASALIQHRLQNRLEPQFGFLDRGGRSWPSHKFIRTVWRQSALNSYNETVLLTLADFGETIAEVLHPQNSWKIAGRQIALTSGSSLPTYGDVRSEIFHPNSDAYLAGANHARTA